MFYRYEKNSLEKQIRQQIFLKQVQIMNEINDHLLLASEKEIPIEIAKNNHEMIRFRIWELTELQRILFDQNN